MGCYGNNPVCDHKSASRNVKISEGYELRNGTYQKCTFAVSIYIKSDYALS